MSLYRKLTAILTVTLFSVGAWAQSTVLEEIVVTAQKREQLANDVGIAITTFSGTQMNALGFDVSGFYGTSQESFTKPRTYGVLIRRNF